MTNIERFYPGKDKPDFVRIFYLHLKLNMHEMDKRRWAEKKAAKLGDET